ncbi:MAG: hypothetical protein J5819_07715 [Eubacterium sp.]|nr:hypothetical protein [Eubacterium sp.]
MNEENMNNNQNENSENSPKRPLSHRVFAWIAIFLLVGMYTVTLIAALSGSGSASALFMMSLGSTVVLPGLLWLYIRFWNFSSKRDRETFRDDYTGVREGAALGNETDIDEEEKDSGEQDRR